MTTTFFSSHWRRLVAPLALCLPMVSAAIGAPESPQLVIWNADTLTQRCDRTLKTLDKQTAQLARNANSATFLRDWNALQIVQEDAEGPIYLYNSVSPDEKTRRAADDCLLKINRFSSSLLQNSDIYRRARAVKPKNAIDAKLRQDILDAFEDAGVGLAAAERQRVKDILARLELIRQEFERNVRDNKTRLAFTADEVKGLPAAYLQRARRDAEGRYLLGFEYPEYHPFMDAAENEAARARYQFAFVNRGGPRNIELLAEVARLRHEMAKLLGFPSYAHFVTRRRMVGTPEVVQRFLGDVKTAVRTVETQEVEELRRAKATHLQQPLEQVRLQRWDVSFYQERLKRERFQIDQEDLRRYFPTDASVEWILKVSAELYGLRFERAKAAVWHDEVRYYDVFDAASGHRLSGFYLDLFPREGKFSHAAAFGVRGTSRLAGRTPISVLVTNFDRKGLNYNELRTLVHEFGHLMHGVLSTTRYVTHAGTNVETDFVEAPSQMYEEWVRRPESLKLISQLCRDCPPVTDAMIERLNAQHQFGRGIRYARQWLYAAFDMAVYDEKLRPPLGIWQAMEGETPLGHVPDTQFPGQFEHIIRGYGAGYYGYMWSEVVALDMAAQFGDNLMNPKIGKRFRETVLERGGELRGGDLTRAFLGREPSPQAFFIEISGSKKP